MTPGKLAQWLKRTPVESDRLTLIVTTVDGDEPLGDWPPPKAKDEDSLRVLADEIHDTAQSHTEEMNTQLRFNCQAEKDGVSLLRTVMRQRPKEQELAGMTDLGDASGASLVNQSIRHTEAFARIVLSNITQMQDMQREHMELLTKENASLRKREAEVLEIQRELILTHEGDERVADRIDKTIDVLINKLVPGVGVEMGLLPDGWTIEDGAPPKKLAADAASNGNDKPEKTAETKPTDADTEEGNGKKARKPRKPRPTRKKRNGKSSNASR